MNILLWWVPIKAWKIHVVQYFIGTQSICTWLASVLCSENSKDSENHVFVFDRFSSQSTLSFSAGLRWVPVILHGNKIAKALKMFQKNLHFTFYVDFYSAILAEKWGWLKICNLKMVKPEIGVHKYYIYQTIFTQAAFCLRPVERGKPHSLWQLSQPMPGKTAG